MTKRERKKAIDYLKRKRQSLKSRGANPRNVTQYLGQNGAFVDFSTLTDSQLKRMVDRVKSQPKVTVVNGAIYPTRYIRNRQYLELEEGFQPLVKDYSSALNSRLNNMTLTEYKKYRKSVNKQTKDNWNKMIREAYDGINESKVNELNRFINSLNPKQLTQFLDVVDLRLGFSKIIYPKVQQGLVRDIEDGSELFESLSHELDVLYSLYKDFIM